MTDGEPGGDKLRDRITSAPVSGSGSAVQHCGASECTRVATDVHEDQNHGFLRLPHSETKCWRSPVCSLFPNVEAPTFD